MATQQQATAHAARLANRLGQTVYVVYDVTDGDTRVGYAYHTATAEDLATYYGGVAENDIVAAIEPQEE